MISQTATSTPKVDKLNLQWFTQDDHYFKFANLQEGVLLCGILEPNSSITYLLTLNYWNTHCKKAQCAYVNFTLLRHANTRLVDAPQQWPLQDCMSVHISTFLSTLPQQPGIKPCISCFPRPGNTSSSSSMSMSAAILELKPGVFTSCCRAVAAWMIQLIHLHLFWSLRPV